MNKFVLDTKTPDSSPWQTFLYSAMLILLLALPKLAYCDIAIIVNANSPVSALTKDQVKNIFLGRLTRFPNTNMAVSAMEIKQNNAQKEAFYMAIANKTVNKINRYWARYLFTGKMSPPKKLSSNQEIIDSITNTPSGISYIESSDVPTTVKVVLTLPTEQQQ